MEWLIAVALRPLGSALLFAGAYLLARGFWYFVPDGPVKKLLYDRTIRRRHPWKFALLAMASVWGTVALIALYYQLAR